MRSATPKVLHPICGRPMVAWPVKAALDSGAERVMVIKSPGHDLSPALPEGTETVDQPRPDGTGGAIRAASTEFEDLAATAPDATVVVLSGDGPLIAAADITALVERHVERGAGASVFTAIVENPGSFGRVIRNADGDFERIVEAKGSGDATPEQLEIREVNSGIYAFAAAPLLRALGEIDSDNAQGEYYLPDVLPKMKRAGCLVQVVTASNRGVMMGVNDRADLAAVEAEARGEIQRRHMLAGVTIVDPATTWIDAEVEIEPDATVLPGSYLRGRTRIASGSMIGPHCFLDDAVVLEGASIVQSHLIECEVGPGASVGPFAYLRPGTRLAAGAKVGTFVEVKNSELAEGAKVPHLSYVGDADIGEKANLGAGTITANYDGLRKYRTVVGEGARVGVDTMLIAPVEIGPGAYTGGGSVISKDVPAGSLGISRAKQRNIDRYAERKAEAANEEEDS